MYIKKLKRKCNVRGCRNTESYAISKTREMGNSVIICKECLEEALKTIEEAENLTFKEAIPVATETPAEAIPDAVIEDINEEGNVLVPVDIDIPPKRKRKK